MAGPRHLVHLEDGGATATVDLAAGGRLASFVVRGRERLVTRPDIRSPLPAITWGSFVMVPWVGRMRGGLLTVDGATYQLPRNFTDHAIHGATFDLPWDVTARTARSVGLRHRLGGTDRWPFEADVSQSIELSSGSLAFVIEVRAGEAMPVAAGWHPWFRRAPDEPIRVTVPADRVLETDGDMIPTGGTVPVAEQTDLRRSPDVSARRLDHAYIGVAGPCTVDWPDLRLVIDATPVGSVVVHTTPDAVCVEPQTAWPDAIRLAAPHPDGGRASAAGGGSEGAPATGEPAVDTGLVMLRSGGAFVARSRWTWTELPES